MPSRLVGSQRRVALVALAHLVDFLDRVEEAHHIRRTEGFARLDLLAVDLLDHHDNSPGALTAPGLIDDRGLERQPRQPGAVLARLWIAQVICPNKIGRRPVRVASVAEFSVRWEWRKELARWDAQPFGAAQIAEIHLAESVALLVSDASWIVVTKKHLFGIIDAVDAVHGHEVSFSFGKHNELRPQRAGFATRGGILVVVGRLHCDEIVALDHLRLDRLHS